MVLIAAVIIICINLILSLMIGIYALFRSQSDKKNYFLLMQVMIIVYLLGYLLEITSTNAEEAFSAVKIMYVGAYFIPVFTFFLAADFCNIRLHPVYIKTPMLLLALAIVIAFWTTKQHQLIYMSYNFGSPNTVGLVFTPGPYYTLTRAYSIICMILTIAVLLYQFKKWSNKYRKPLIVFLVCLSIPLLTEAFGHLAVFLGPFVYYIYLTPYSMAIMNIYIYIGVMRFNIFEIIPAATLTAMDHIREGFVLLDENSNYLSSNSAAAILFPGIKNLVKGESIFSAGDWPEELREINTDKAEFSITNGDIKYIEASINSIVTGKQAQKAKIIILRDITESKTLMKKLENAAYIDSLTGLYNRKHFSELAALDIEKAKRERQSIFVAMLDLDFFKNVNDSYGHDAGDLVLKTTANIVRNTIRSYDLLGRYGGEEFVILITNLEDSVAFRQMERIRENMERASVPYENIKISITCSIGLAKFTEADTLETSIKKADEALYTAKNSGRNLVKVYSAG